MKYIILVFLLSFFLLGCAGLQPDTPKPVVSINSFKMLPSSSITPRFEITLGIINTSRESLDIVGLVYTVKLKGNQILTGVAKDIPTIEPYSEANVSVSGSPDLFGSFGLFKDMMGSPGGSIEYEVDISIDAGSYYPMIHTSKAGKLSLSDMIKAK